MKNIKPIYYILGAVVIVLLGVSIFFMTKGSKSAANEDETSKDSVFDEGSEEIEKVDSSVEVNIKGNTDAIITVSGIPDGTDSIEYELSYNTKDGSIEGVFGTIEVKGSKAEEEVTFGTCSSGVCRYHDIDGPVSGTFIFEGDYGKKMLESEFDL